MSNLNVNNVNIFCCLVLLNSPFPHKMLIFLFGFYWLEPIGNHMHSTLGKTGTDGNCLVENNPTYWAWNLQCAIRLLSPQNSFNLYQRSHLSGTRSSSELGEQDNKFVLISSPWSGAAVKHGGITRWHLSVLQWSQASPWRWQAVYPAWQLTHRRACSFAYVWL